MKTAAPGYAVLVIAVTMSTMAGLADRALAGHPLWQNQFAVAYAEAPSEKLNLKSLELRLRKTDSVGLFTKLALKAEFDGLLEDFSLHHLGRSDDSIEALMARFARLMGRTLKLVRKGDPVLFRTLASSRDALRTVFSDPAKFAAAMGQAKPRLARRRDR